LTAVLEALDLVADESASSSPLSLRVGNAEIVGLLFPAGRPRGPILRVLAGFDAPKTGHLRIPHRGSPLLAAELLRLNRAARDLLAEMRRLSRSSEERSDLRRTAADLAAVTIDEKVLDSVIASAEDRPSRR
jgi:hypothetical protein